MSTEDKKEETFFLSNDINIKSDKEEKSPSALDSLFTSLGNPGSFQVILFCILSVSLITVAGNHASGVFFGYTPPFRCQPSSGQDQEVTGTSYSEPSMTLHANTTSTFPGYDNDCTSVKVFEDSSNVTFSCPQNVWIFDVSDGQETIVTEWHLVCDKAYLKHLAITLYYVGIVIGGFVFGYLSDRIGRKPTLVMVALATIGLGVGAAFTENFVLFVVIRVLIGAVIQGMQNVSFVLAVEMFSPRYRAMAGTTFQLLWGVGMVYLGAMAWAAKDWRIIQILLTAPTMITALLAWWIPESLRWLLARDKSQEARDVIKRIARWNKVPRPVTLKLCSTSWVTVGNDHGQVTFLALLSSGLVRRRVAIICYIWFAINVAYWGIMYLSADLLTNLYLNFFLTSVVEIICYACNIYLIYRFGRKRPLAIYFFTSGSICILLASIIGFRIKFFTTFSMVITVIGRMSSASMFSVLELYTNELLPTTVRARTSGMCAAIGRLGAVVAAQILMLQTYTFLQVPPVIFGATAILGGILTVFLPETMNTELPDTLEDMELHVTAGKQSHQLAMDKKGAGEGKPSALMNTNEQLTNQAC